MDGGGVYEEDDVDACDLCVAAPAEWRADLLEPVRVRVPSRPTVGRVFSGKLRVCGTCHYNWDQPEHLVKRLALCDPASNDPDEAGFNELCQFWLQLLRGFDPLRPLVWVRF